MSDARESSRFTEWFRKWRSPLRKFLIGRSAIASADLEDVSQEVFLRLLRYDRIHLIEHPQAYLFKVASNVAAEWSIRSRVRFPHDSRWLVELVSEEQLEDCADQQHLQLAVGRVVNTLSAYDQEVLRLQFADGLKRNEIAEQLQTTERSVKRSLFKSYEKLRKELKPGLLGGDSHGRE